MNAPVRPPLILTDAQFEDMARKGAFSKVGRVELRGGMLSPMSPVHYNHANVMFLLTRAVAAVAEGAGLRVLNEISIAFGAGFQPTADIVVWDPALVPADLDGPLPRAAVKLVIEVADASLADDMGDKLGDYAEAGLAEYWVADVRGRLLMRHRRPEGRTYAVSEPLAFGAPAQSLTLPLTVATDGL